jgi:NAD+ synthase
VSQLPNATGQAIAGCGHHPHQGKPDVVSRTILDFFAQHPVRPVRPVEADAALRIDPARVASLIEAFVRDQMDRYQREGVVLPMSGGLDSSVMAHLASRAVGPDQVLALLLPERDSSPDSKTHALLEIERLGIAHREVDLTPALAALGIYDRMPLQILGLRSLKAAIVQHQHRVQTEALGETPFRAGLLGTRDLRAKKDLIDAGNAYTRVKHRMRLVALYYFADLENRLVLGTSNRSEALTGLLVKWGSNVADVEPLLPLYQTQVRQLAHHLGVSEPILTKAPSPDLIPGIVDGLALGMDYETLDKILWGLDEGWDSERIVASMPVTCDQVAHVQEMQRRSRHLRILPPHPDLALA